MKRLWLGGHLSAESGLRHIVVNARALNYSVIQTMLGGGREYTPWDVTQEDVNEFRTMSYGMALFVHMPYVINPCEGSGNRKGFYKRAFKEYAESAAALGARAVVIHPGFKKDLTDREARDNFLKFMDSTYEEEWNLQVLIETDSGSKNGSAVGSPEFIDNALRALGTERFGMCIDTMHLYGRGVDLWDQATRKDFLKDYDKLIKLVHLNSPDPQVELGSFKDAHNTPFEDRPTWDHQGLFFDLKGYPCILERRSLAVQEQDAAFIRKTLELTENDGYQDRALAGGVPEPAEGS